MRTKDEKLWKWYFSNAGLASEDDQIARQTNLILDAFDQEQLLLEQMSQDCQVRWFDKIMQEVPNTLPNVKIKTRNAMNQIFCWTFSRFTCSFVEILFHGQLFPIPIEDYSLQDVELSFIIFSNFYCVFV